MGGGAGVGTGVTAGRRSRLRLRLPALERRDGYWLWWGGPVGRGASATTWGSVVAVRRGVEPSERLLLHERVHVEQWRRYGVVGFLARYVAAYARGRLRGYSHHGAYLRIPFEAQAEWRARRAVGLGVLAPPDAAAGAPPAPAAGGISPSR